MGLEADKSKRRRDLGIAAQAGKHGVARTDPPGLGLVNVHPHMQWIHRPHRHQRIEYNTRLRIFAEPHIDLEDRAIDRRLDYRLGEIDPRLVEWRLRLAKL